jgi:amino acid adenylation domain-containing protein
LNSVDAAALVEELAAQDIHLWVEGGALRFRSRPGALTDPLRARITANRAALIDYLGAKDKAPAVEESVQDLIAWLQARDIKLSVSDGKLKVNAPKGAADEVVRSRVAARRDELIAALTPAASNAVELIRVSRTGELPLSHNQKRLWFMKQLDPGSPAYNVPAVLIMRGALDVPELEQALAAVVERHESLRTRFVVADGTPRCVVEAQAATTLIQESLESEAAATARALELISVPFDLAQCPLIHAHLLRVSAQYHVLICVVDHIIADGLSIGILIGEVFARYAQRGVPGGPAIPALEYQYLDYADWQRRRFASGELEEKLSYWKKELAGLPPALQLPTDRPRPPIQTYVGTRAVGVAPETQTLALKALARSESATLFMVLMSAFQALLHRYTSETDIPVGTAISSRGRAEFSTVIGFFANNVVMRGDLSGSPSAREAIRRTRDVALRGFPHEDMPFDVLVDALVPRRSLDHSPLFQVMFVLQSGGRPATGLPELKFEVPELALRTSRFDLSVDAMERDGVLHFSFEYNTDLFDRETGERMVEHYLAMLAGYAATPDLPVSQIPLLSDAERRKLLSGSNPASQPIEEPRTVHGLFEAQARRTPETVAVRFEGAEIRYAELDARANQVASFLLSQPLGDDRLVGIWMERGIDMVVALLGVLKAGCAYVPLDPAFPRDRIAFMAEDAGLTVVLTQSALANEFPASDARRICLDADWAQISVHSAAKPVVDVAPSDLAYVIYTSGSTGRPKGVQLEHLGVVNFLRSMHREPGIGPRDRLVSVTTLSFDIAGLEIYGPLCAGGTVVLASRAIALDGLALAQLLNRSDATIMQATPATWRLLLDTGWSGKAGLKMLCGGEALPRDLAVRLLATGGELWNLYGPTETTIWSTITRVVDVSRAIPIGRPIANTTVYVLEPSGQLAPVGVPGELCIGGIGVARGYRNRPELTKEKFVTLELEPGKPERVYRTGDMARWRADGQLEFVGRRDHQVKVRGFRIELEEIEAVLSTHPGVQQCVVAVREDTPGDQRLVGYVIGASFDATAARATLRSRLPDYMIPSQFMTLESLPLTPNGKVDRRALPPPVVAESIEEERGRTPAEQRVAAIWRDVLQVERVGLNQNFFDAGGHSLLLARLQAALTREFGIELPLYELFQRTTVATQAQRLSESGEGAPEAAGTSALQRAKARAARQSRGA